MSLHPVSSYSVPELTARVARTAFPKGNLCLRLYDELGTIFTDHDFAELGFVASFPVMGIPLCFSLDGKMGEGQYEQLQRP